MRTIVVSGALANRPGNGGGAWVRLSWIRGLQRLGFRVHFLEQITRAAGLNVEYFDTVCRRFGLAGDATLIRDANVGAAEYALAESADLLVNLGGHLTIDRLLQRFRRKAYIDIDPGFTQFWHADADITFRVAPHDFYFTIAENIGRSDCPIPTSDIPWRTMRQPVVLEDWPVTSPPALMPRRFTTVASWRGAFGPVADSGGKTYGVKAHEFRRIAALPRLAPGVFELAVDIRDGDHPDRALLLENGWQLADPRLVASDPNAFRAYVQGSHAEFSVAQGIYVHTNSGWFSDRTTRYLAAGRPALVQDTGFSRTLSADGGLIPFRTMDEAVAGAARIAADYPAHCQAARRVAEEYFDSDKVLGKFLEEVGVSRAE